VVWCACDKKERGPRPTTGDMCVCLVGGGTNTGTSSVGRAAAVRDRENRAPTSGAGLTTSWGSDARTGVQRGEGIGLTGGPRVIKIFNIISTFIQTRFNPKWTFPSSKILK
jgi:hypothetical protein